MKRWLSFLMALTLDACLAVPVFAQTLPIPLLQGPQPVPAAMQMINPLINQINAVLVPVLGPTSSGGVNEISLTGGTTGNNAVIGLQTGADANAGITINPNGSGNIQLFGDGDTGVLKFGNTSAFVPATGLTACPATATLMQKNRPFGVASVVTGYLIVKDWAGTSHGVPAC